VFQALALPSPWQLPRSAKLLLLLVGLLTVAVVLGKGVLVVAVLTLATAVLVFAVATIRTWHALIAIVVVIVLFIPIRRYQFASGLPFDLEPYRIFLAVVGCFWIAGLLTDARVRIRGSGFEGPLGLFLLAVLGSLLTNMDRLRAREYFILNGATFVREDLAIDVLKTFLFLLSFYLVFYFTLSVVRNERSIHAMLKVLVGGTAIVGFFALIEARTGYNLFDHLQAVLPGSTFTGALTTAGIARAGRLRVYGSAQHPIALAVLFVMVLPLAIYLWRYTRTWIWLVASAVLMLGAVSTVSRTSITTMAAALAVFLWLRRDSVKRLWPLVLPGLVLIHIVTPGVIGGLQEAFFPSKGLIADQTVYEGRVSSERLKPEFGYIKANPAFGRGYGTRITEATLRQNAHVLDDQWLGTGVETGLVGVGAWVWLFARFIRRAGREAKRDRSARGWLLTALAASVAAFALGMLTYDAFSFIQVTFVLYIVMAIGACVLKANGPWDSPTAAVVLAPERFRRTPRRNP
jgi:O-antigen ligase